MIYTARLSAEYTPAEDDEAIVLCRKGDLLYELPQTEWELQTHSAQFVGRAWGADYPQGNARYRITLAIAVAAPTVAQLESRLRRLEYTLNTRRRGELTLREAYHGDTALYTTRWVAVIMQAKGAVADSDSAPPAVVQTCEQACAAWGRLDVELSLTDPEEI